MAIIVIDVKTHSVIASLPVGLSVGSSPLAITPDGKLAYVANEADGNPFDNTVSVIETTTNSIIATIPVGSPNNTFITPDGKLAYVTNQGTLVVQVTLFPSLM
ncbi:hypothetical protein [Bacillus sp. SM2101]|uniref:YncE family protein n=1 Tax=Bacillus sp. SM2101 TaxID=2805366 RepID=UPI001BDDE804|nr:hypothetical protein [Bacillus sp. SM2101]